MIFNISKPRFPARSAASHTLSNPCTFVEIGSTQSLEYPARSSAVIVPVIRLSSPPEFSVRSLPYKNASLPCSAICRNDAAKSALRNTSPTRGAMPFGK